MKRKSLLAAALALSLTAVWAQTSQARPSLFSDLTFSQAKKKSKAAHKLLLIDFTAVWCGPCHMMDETTWADERVQNWIKANAIAIQVDVDQDRETSRALRIEAMPTLVVFQPKGKSEFTRELGYQKPQELLDWLEKIKSGVKPPSTSPM